MSKEMPAVDWGALPIDWFQPGVLPEARRQDLVQRLPRNWYEKGVLPEEHRLSLLRDFLTEGARRWQEFVRIDPREWRQRPREERDRMISEGFANLRRAIGVFGVGYSLRWWRFRQKKRDYWDDLLYLEPTVEAEIGAGALEVSETAYLANPSHLLPVTGQRDDDIERHNFEWQDMFMASKELLRTKAKHLRPHDRLYRMFIIGDRLKNFCLRYLEDRGWDERFIATVDSYLIELVAKSATSPPDRPLPE